MARHVHGYGILHREGLGIPRPYPRQLVGTLFSGFGWRCVLASFSPSIKTDCQSYPDWLYKPDKDAITIGALSTDRDRSVEQSLTRTLNKNKMYEFDQDHWLRIEAWLQSATSYNSLVQHAQKQCVGN